MAIRKRKILAKLGVPLRFPKGGAHKDKRKKRENRQSWRKEWE